MAFFYPAAVASGAWLLGSYLYDLREKLDTPVADLVETNVAEREPFQGPIGHISKWIHSDLRQFRSVQESVDELGAKIFLVDYGSGAKTIQYVDPRILL